MKKMFGLVLITCSLFAFASDGSISGKIISGTDQRPLPYVNISIGNNLGALSDENGLFKIENLSNGTYIVKLKYIGYEDHITEGLVINDQNKNIDLPQLTLTKKTIQIEEVMVVHYTNEFDEKYSGTNNVIAKELLRAIQPIGTEEILKTIPGVNVSGDMGISNRLNIGIRGSYPRRSDKVLIMEDGTPVAPAPYLAPSAYYNPPSERLDGIEIIKGAEVLTYGPNNMYGVVNYITRRPPLKPTFYSSFSAGSHGYLSGLLSYGGTWNNVGAELQVLGKKFDGYTNNSSSQIFNVTGKIYADLGDKQSLYLKVNYHAENSNATYSALTPLTFDLDPEENPFDADDLLTTRYGADIVHKLAFGKSAALETKFYANQFKRDWWRQNNTVIQANDARDYLGDEIFFDRYAYLDRQDFTDDDYVRVGKITNGNETTKARNRLFLVTGLQETVKSDWQIKEHKQEFEASFKFHTERFDNQEITNDSSRFARSGRIVLDQQYRLHSVSGHVKNTFAFGDLHISPAVRIEYIKMSKEDVLANSTNPNNTGNNDDNKIRNTFFEVLPGVSFNYYVKDDGKNKLTAFASIYKGYTPPTSSVGFLAVEDKSICSPVAEEDINMKPEISLDLEGGIRGSALHNGISGQLSYFYNHINNFYAAGRKEAFQTLGSVTIHGIEAAMTVHIDKLIQSTDHYLSINGTLTVMQSKITSGRMKDSDILKVKHTETTKEELTAKINANPEGFNVYFEDADGNDSLINSVLAVEDFSDISSFEAIFGDEGLKDNRAPYIPEFMFSFGLNYEFEGVGLNLTYSRIGSQYTEYLNLDSESGEGAIGKLDAIHTFDATLSYSFKNLKNKKANGLRIHVTGKNLFNDVYKASRLHRVSSGIFPGGFVQVNGGIEYRF